MEANPNMNPKPATRMRLINPVNKNAPIKEKSRRDWSVNRLKHTNKVLVIPKELITSDLFLLFTAIWHTIMLKHNVIIAKTAKFHGWESFLQDVKQSMTMDTMNATSVKIGSPMMASASM